MYFMICQKKNPKSQKTPNNNNKQTDLLYNKCLEVHFKLNTIFLLIFFKHIPDQRS